MRKRIQNLGALLLALVLSLSLAAPAHAAGDTVSAAARTAAASAMTAGQAAQIGWAVWRDGEIIASGSQRADGQPPEGDAYAAGSISKVFTAAAALRLAEAGKLNLDQPVVKYLPSFKMADPRYKDITVRMLLNHSSGLMGGSLVSTMLFGDPTSPDLLKRLSTQRLKAAPGAYSVYCNDGFTLAELVVEAVSGMSFQDYIRANILAPAGLRETWFPGEDIESRRAPIYPKNSARTEPLPKDCMNVLGAAGLYATPEDIAAFGGALTDETLLKKSSLDAMASPEYARGIWPEAEYPNTMTFGLGWDNVAVYPFAQNGITALAKGGDTGYYHAGLVVLPEYHLSAAVLSAGGRSTYNEMAASRMLIAALREENVDVAELRLRLPAAQRADMPGELLSAAGYYGAQTVYELKLTQDGALKLAFPAAPDLPERSFYYCSDGTFRDEGGGTALRIVKEKNGQAYLYQWNAASVSGLGYLYTSQYIAMKLPANPVSTELQTKWNAMLSGELLPMNERYTSQTYMALGFQLQVEPGKAASAPGYIGALRIEDEARLRYAVQIPGSAGRDGADVEARRDAKGALWLYQSDGAVYMEKAAAPTLSTGADNRAACTIQPDGYARWYKIGESAAGKRMTVEAPENAGFWVYDSRGAVTASSVAWGDVTASLPEDGLIAFAGDPGARFRLTFQ